MALTMKVVGRVRPLLLLLPLLAVLSCAGDAPDPAGDWPLACGSFPGPSDAVAHCARRDPSGEVVLRPGVVTGEGTPDAVLVEGELYFALTSGKTAPALLFDNGPDYWVEGLARTVRDGKIGFVNQDLEVVVPRTWDFAFPFEDGLAQVCTGCLIVHEDGDEHGSVRGGAWGVIDRQGRVVVPVAHDRESLPSPG